MTRIAYLLLIIGFALLSVGQEANSWFRGLTCQSNAVVAYGDSITFGSQANNVSYVAYAQPPPAYKYNGSVPGAGMTGTGSDPGWAKLDALTAGFIASRCSTAVVIASELFGFNDFALGRSTSFFLGTVSDWADARRAAGVKVICISLLPSTDASAPTYNAWRNTVNTTLTTWGPGGGGAQHCDGIADFGADATMGPDAAPNNTLLYADKLHPTTLGQQTLAPIYQVAVQALLP